MQTDSQAQGDDFWAWTACRYKITQWATKQEPFCFPVCQCLFLHLAHKVCFASVSVVAVQLGVVLQPEQLKWRGMQNNFNL